MTFSDICIRNETSSVFDCCKIVDVISAEDLALKVESEAPGISVQIMITHPSFELQYPLDIWHFCNRPEYPNGSCPK